MTDNIFNSIEREELSTKKRCFACAQGNGSFSTKYMMEHGYIDHPCKFHKESANRHMVVIKAR